MPKTTENPQRPNGESAENPQRFHLSSNKFSTEQIYKAGLSASPEKLAYIMKDITK